MNLLLLTLSLLAADRPAPFAITVVDDATGRGVPLVELRTVNEVRLVTDSAGVVAFDEPGLMDRRVFFHVRSHGYEFPKDGFGIRGRALDVKAGGSAELKIRRLNVAERLYRVTGGGIYRDSVLVGRKPPTREPLLNGQVFGQDSVLNAVLGGKLYWFWGDTNRPSYPLGNFHSPGATSELPGHGGLDPDVGVDLSYFNGPDGFARPTAEMPGPGPTWLGGLVVVHDSEGREQMFAAFAKIRNMLEAYERGLARFDPESNRFEKVLTFPVDAPARPDGHPFLHQEGGQEYVYYATPYPLTRVPADPEALKDLSRYESFTCLATGSDLKDPKLDRDPDGGLRYGWKAGTPAVGPGEQAKLIKAGLLRADEVLLPLRDVETGKAVQAHGGSVAWNEYRRRWSLIFVELFGTSMLGEVWYAEADTPLGPWTYARKVVTHDKYSFYNPKQHPAFAKEGGRLLYFEGTYTTSFSGSTDPTPRYDYNQIMYRLDLGDPRLNLPVPIYDLSDDRIPDRFAAARAGRPVAFYALERPAEGTVPIYSTDEGTRSLRAGDGPGKPLFHALPRDREELPKTAVPLFEFVRRDDSRRAYSTDPEWSRPGFRRAAEPVCHVWRNPTRLRLPAD